MIFKEEKRKMSPKVVSVPPPLDKAWSGQVTVKNARVVKDQFTSIGNIPLGLGLTVTQNDDPEETEYSALFSLKTEGTIGGSIGRILTELGFKEFDASKAEEVARKIKGMSIRVQSRGGKHYWYP